MPFATQRPQRVLFARWSGNPGDFPFPTSPYVPQVHITPCGVCGSPLDGHAVARMPNGRRALMCVGDVVVWVQGSWYRHMTAAEFAAEYQEEPEP